MDDSNKRVAIVVARFNEPVTSRLLEGAKAHFKSAGWDMAQLEVVWVPGAVEIPLVAQTLARTKKFAAIVCLGAVIRGETGHYDYVCEQVSDGVMRVMLDHNLPVVFGVLTTDNSDQAFARAGGEHSDKGAESAQTALEMIDVVAKYV